jgi:hypothetical protein
MQINLRHAQGIVAADRTRFKILVTGRRFGKTFYTNFELVRGATERPGLYWYIAPTLEQSRDYAWDLLKAMIPAAWLKSKPNETRLEINLVNGSRITLKGCDKPDSLVGRGISGVVLDEAALYKGDDVWTVSIQPALADKKGWAVFATTVRRGFRAQWFMDLYNKTKRGEKDDNWKAFSFTTLEGDNVAPEEIERLKADMDPKKFRQEFLAQIEDDDGRVAVSFDESSIQDVGDDDSYPLLVGIDFNVDPFCAVVGVKVPVKEGETSHNELHIFDEIELQDATTWDMAELLNEKYGYDRVKKAFPDPTGNSRRTSGVGVTDHAILRRSGITVVTPGRPWRIRDKITAVNTGLKDANGRRRVKINPKCEQLIRSLRNLMYDERTGLPDKTQGMDHFFDALGYLCLMQFNLATGPSFERSEYKLYGSEESESLPAPPADAPPTMFSYRRRR